VKAQYLLRFDDLCPTMDGERWRRFAALIERFEIKPILGVTPDNRDPELMIDAPDEGFWEEMRRLEAGGATIGLHGYRHVCDSEARSLVPLHGRSEFAGVAREQQRCWIRAGLEILRGHGLDPVIWVAPRHGFDAVTLEVLRDEGIGMVSDGFAKKPFRHFGVTWIPQQLWRPVEKQDGVWTICVHPNTATGEDVLRLEGFLERFAGQFVPVGSLDQSVIRRRSVADWLFHAGMVMRIRWKGYKRRWA